MRVLIWKIKQWYGKILTEYNEYNLQKMQEADEQWKEEWRTGVAYMPDMQKLNKIIEKAKSDKEKTKTKKYKKTTRRAR